MNINPNYDYLKFESNRHSSFRMTDYLPNIQYSLDGESFVDYSSGELIHFDDTLYIQWEGVLFNNTTIGTLELHGENIKVSGRLLHGDVPHAYRGLFSGCNDITDASGLVLSSETVGEYAYFEMFSGCKQLVSVPELPATTLSEGCYSHMFSGCTSLTTVPELPATTLAPYCYDSMFSFCTSLTRVPNLIDTDVDFVYKEMFYGCTGLEDFLELTDEQYNSYTYSGIFDKCMPAVATFNLRKTRSVDPVLQAPSALADTEDWLGFINVYSTASTIKLNNYEPTISYSIDGVTFTSYTKNTTINIEVGGSIYFKWTGALKTSYNRSTIVTTSGGLLNVSGRLLHGGSQYSYYYLFYNSKQIKDASNILLPATTLASNCYQSMFNGCTGLTTAPELPATTLANYCYQNMFQNCTSLTTAPELPATTLANYCYQYMFSGCTGLTTAPELPATTLTNNCYYEMFYGCSSLTTVIMLNPTAPTSSSYIGNMFRNTPSTKVLFVPIDATGYSTSWAGTTWASVEYFLDLGNSLTYFPLTFEIMSEEERTMKVVHCDPEATVADIPVNVMYNGNVYAVTSIEDSAFNGCSSLTSVNIPNGVTSIEDYMFSDCSSLTSISIPNSVTSIGNYVFSDCTSLTTFIMLNPTAPSISNTIFQNTPSTKVLFVPIDATGYSTSWGNTTWTNVEYVLDLGNGLTSFPLTFKIISKEEHAIEVSTCDSSATVVDIPANVMYNGTIYSITSIGVGAFYDNYGCSSLTSVNIGNGVTSIGAHSFSGCSKLTSVTIPDSVTTIGSAAFHGCINLTSVNIPNSVTHLGFPVDPEQDPGGMVFWDCKSLISITIPDSVTYIGEFTFYGCSGLTSVTIPDSVTYIGTGVFDNCSSLTTLTIGDGVAIENGAFYGCSSLTTLTIGDGVTIDDGMFQGCNSLTTVYSLSPTAPATEYGFYGTPSTKVLFVPVGATGYSTSWGGSTWATVNYNMIPTDKIVYKFNDEHLLETFRSNSKTESLTIPHDVLYNGNGYIVDKLSRNSLANDEKIKTLTIESGITKIEASALSGCNNLETVNIPESVTKIDNHAFWMCSNLKNITLPNALIKLKPEMFVACEELQEITIPNGITKIPFRMFEGCRNLTTVNLPNTITEIQWSAFKDCINLTTINIPSGCVVDSTAFEGTNITI